MKFEYTTTTERDPVAYIDVYGDLVIKEDIDASILLKKSNQIQTKWKWKPTSAKQLLYRGDRVTITL